MKNFYRIIIILFLSSFANDTFKEEQKKYSHVKQAYNEKESLVINNLRNHSIEISRLRIYLRAFKKEKKIELWAKNSSDTCYQLIKQYNICRISGDLGPKRKEGDSQIPEGFYSINMFNPTSNFYLSLGLNYPNKSDRILSDKVKPGGAIFIHGACVTIGCIPVTDDLIKELYVYCVEAKNSGQDKIPVTIFPTELTDVNFKYLMNSYRTEPDKIGLWSDLKNGFDLFNETKRLPVISFLKTGRHNINN